MEENLLEGAKEKFANARKYCPGMPEEVYALTDYMSTTLNDKLIPAGLLVSLTLVMDDIEKGVSGFNNKPLDTYLRTYKDTILANISYIPQFVDTIASEEFAREFRLDCQNVLGINPPKRVFTETNEEYPENIRVAVDWWANAIQTPQYNSSPAIMMAGVLAQRKNFTEEEINIFKDSLAKIIQRELDNNGRCSLSVDYSPCPMLLEAGNKIGVNSFNGYPWKTRMEISYEDVIVRGSSIDQHTLYSSDKKGIRI